METAIQLSSITKYFYKDNARLTAVHDVNLSIQDGSFVSLIGPSGCGKSTVLNMIAGLMKPDEGEIRHDGVVLEGTAADAGYMTQHDALLPWRTIEQNVRLPLEVRREARTRAGRAAVKERVDWALKLVRLDGFERHLPREVSGGMRQRAALAQTLVYARKSMLMDEPFGALDSQTRLQLQRELTKIWSTERRTVVFVTHDIEEAISLSDHIVILDSGPGRVGEVVDVGLTRPRDPVTTRFEPEYQDLFRYVWNRMHPEDRDERAQIAKDSADLSTYPAKGVRL